MLQAAAVDLSRCDQEPIQIPGSIQPHGVLIVLSEPELIVTQVSANIEALLGLSVRAVRGASLSTIFTAAQVQSVQAALARNDAVAISPMRFEFDVSGAARDFACVMHRFDGQLIMELEPFAALDERASVDVFAHVGTPFSRMIGASDVLTLVGIAAAEVREISGFDRVMVYRFDEDRHGEIVAEEKGNTFSSTFLGLHFPASDIPEQARRLYLENALRLIPDVDYTPVAIVPELDPLSGRPLDLSRAILRSVSPIHREYLQNMDVRATLTMSIVVSGRLWGLIACHHAKPRYIDYGTRAICELLSHMLAWQLGARLDTEDLQMRLQATAMVTSSTATLDVHKKLTSGLMAGAQGLLDLFDSQGLALMLDGEIWRVGATPPEDAIITQIAHGLKDRLVDGIAAAHALGELVPDAPSSAQTAGALLLTLSEARGDYLLCFRREMVHTVDWAGDIREPATELAGGLHPRRSFALWKETVRGESLRWSTHDITTAHVVRRRIVERSQTLERVRAEENIRFLAHHDALTQLPNRPAFYDHLQSLVRQAEREESLLAVLFVDLDRFKVFNDAFGHATGDRILQAAAERMRSCVRHDDIVARLGGDEFVIISANLTSEHDADTIAGKVIAAIAKPLSVANRPEIRFTASLGIAVYPKDARDAETLLQYADLAMYRAKEKGRNGFQRFGFGDAKPAYELFTLERRIEQGLEDGEFVPYYQPIVSLQNGKVVSLEALARWVHPERGLLPPAEFIALAEESRLIIVLGKAMLQAACAHAARWRLDPAAAALRVSVNVSARQFRDDGFLDTVRQALTDTGLAPQALQLELTETMLLGDEQYAMKTLRALADDGISIAIDDFGTGYSSLSYLKRLPVDALKIDQSFIRELTPASDDSAIVRAVISMAHSLKLAVIAEGVETEEQLEYLQGEGCDSVQGYLIAKPLAHSAATAFIAQFAANRVNTALWKSGRLAND